MVTETSLERLATIAREAGAAAMAHYGVRTAVELKSDRSPVTEADRAAHRVIARALAAWIPDVPVVSEEGDIAPWEVRRGWRRFWLVDPLDGTKEFLQANGEFTVNIALIEDGVPVLGVVYAPALDVLYSAGRGLGTWKREAGGEAVRLYGPSESPAEGLIVVESRSHPSPALEAFLKTVKVARRVRAGSSLKFGLVAEGVAHLYPRFGPTHEWDVAAGDCVWRNAAAHGQRPSPLEYNTPSLLNGGFVIGVAA
jgi:3'(2'), 5'-bisphosphate nucleotidase